MCATIQPALIAIGKDMRFTCGCMSKEKIRQRQVVTQKDEI